MVFWRCCEYCRALLEVVQVIQAALSLTELAVLGTRDAQSAGWGLSIRFFWIEQFEKDVATAGPSKHCWPN